MVARNALMLTVCAFFVSARKWRSDERCGTSLNGTVFTAPDGTRPAKCDAGSSKPCCSKYGHCGMSWEHCACPTCIDYRKGAAPNVGVPASPRWTPRHPVEPNIHMLPSRKPGWGESGNSRLGLGGTVCKTVYGDDRISCFDCEKRCLPCGFVCRNPGPDRPMPPRYAQPSLDLHYQASDPQRLSGTLGSELSILSHLQSVYLYDNRISGTLPTSLLRLSQLNAIDINGNAFSGTLPTQIGLLSNLRTLRLEANQLSGTLPTQLARLTLLQAFSVNSNLFSGTIPDTFAHSSFQPRSCHLTNAQKQLRRLIGTSPAGSPDTNKFLCPLPALSRSCLESSPGSRLMCYGWTDQGNQDSSGENIGRGTPSNYEGYLDTYGYSGRRSFKAQIAPSLREPVVEQERLRNAGHRDEVHLNLGIGIAVLAAAAFGCLSVVFLLLAACPTIWCRRCPQSRIAWRHSDSNI